MEELDVTGLTADEIEYWLAGSERAISQIRTQQMRLIREADTRQLPLADGCRSVAEWVAGRMDVSSRSARTLTTTARRLADLSVLSDAAGAGDMAYERVVEVSRLTTESTQSETIEDTRGLDIAGIRRQNARKGHLTSEDERTIAEAEHVVLRPNLDESRWDLWGTLGGLAGRIVDKALADRADSLPTPPDGMRPGVGKRQADALVSVCQDSLDSVGGDGSGSPRPPSTPLVSVFVDATHAAPSNGAAGAFVSDGPRVGPDTLERILCEGMVEVLARTDDGQVLAVGEAGRAIPPKIRRFVLARDGGCVADGCDSRYRLQPHHRVPYAISRSHDPTNLVTLCWWHHHVVIHQYRYTIDPTSPHGRLRFKRPTTRAGPAPP